MHLSTRWYIQPYENQEVRALYDLIYKFLLCDREKQRWEALFFLKIRLPDSHVSCGILVTEVQKSNVSYLWKGRTSQSRAARQQ